jgi:hypothetical protein
MFVTPHGSVPVRQAILKTTREGALFARLVRTGELSWRYRTALSRGENRRRRPENLNSPTHR